MEYNYKKFTPFKMQCLTNFPFIDEDFDALSNYGLLCKIVEYMNNIATNNNLLVDNINDLNNWFKNLDVQEEINKKLDEMAESGELDLVIKKYVDPIYQAFENEVNTKINNQNNEIGAFKTSVSSSVNNIDNKVNNIVSGSPKGIYATVDSLISSDPNHDYIYVVEADGKWYYYDDNTSDWVAGGTYQSTVINPDSPNLINMFRGYNYVDGSNIDDTTNDLNVILNLRSYLYLINKDLVSNLPTNIGIVNNAVCFIVYGLSINYNNENKVQILHDLVSGKNYSRSKYGANSWTNWKEDINDSGNLIKFIDFTYSGNVNDDNKDFNNMEYNSMKSFYLKNNQMLNNPLFNDTSLHYINVMNFGYSNEYFTQLAIETMPNQSIHYRNKNNGVWTEWVTIPGNISNINNYVDYSYLTSVIQEPINLDNKILTFCGDSITAGNFIGSQNVWAKWLSDKLNTSYNNKAVGGSTFAQLEDTTQIINQLTTGVNNPILFIAGGINDYAKSVSKVDFTNAVNNICTWLNENYNGKVIFVTPINHVWDTITNEIPLDWYREEITRIALSNGYSVISGNELGFPTKTGDMATLLYYDGLHPSIIGQQMYANKVYQILK